MKLAQISLRSLVKKVLFRPATRHHGLQRVWSSLHTLSVFGMNYGGGSLIETSGEIWALSHVIRRACKETAEPIVFDVGANIGDYSVLVKQLIPSRRSMPLNRLEKPSNN